MHHQCHSLIITPSPWTMTHGQPEVDQGKISYNVVAFIFMVRYRATTPDQRAGAAKARVSDREGIPDTCLPCHRPVST